MPSSRNPAQYRSSGREDDISHGLFIGEFGSKVQAIGNASPSIILFGRWAEAIIDLASPLGIVVQDHIIVPSRFAVRLSSPPTAFITLPVAVPPGLCTTPAAVAAATKTFGSSASRSWGRRGNCEKSPLATLASRT
jgi:hypothetical protein